MSDDIELLTVAEAAQRLGVPVGRVHRLLGEGSLAAIRKEGEPRIPADFLYGGELVKGLAGTLTVLHDAGYSDEEAIRWLFEPDESLPGTPIQALRTNRVREVRRRAQALAF